jgi:hypothetical protein
MAQRLSMLLLAEGLTSLSLCVLPKTMEPYPSILEYSCAGIFARSKRAILAPAPRQARNLRMLARGAHDQTTTTRIKQSSNKQAQRCTNSLLVVRAF